MTVVYSSVNVGERLTPVFMRYGVKRAVLFGSYATGKAHAGSDVDLLLDSGLRGLDFVALCEDIRGALGKEADVFDVSHVEKNSPLDREIAATGVVIHGQ